MAEASQNIQDVFLNNVRKQKEPLTIFLVNGVKLSGYISAFDNFSVLLRRENHVQLVYKHAISTILPTSNFRFEISTKEKISTTDKQESN